jgi:hypothetical protein
MKVVETIKYETKEICLRLQFSKLSRLFEKSVVVETETRRDWSNVVETKTFPRVSLIPGSSYGSPWWNHILAVQEEMIGLSYEIQKILCFRRISQPSPINLCLSTLAFQFQPFSYSALWSFSHSSFQTFIPTKGKYIFTTFLNPSIRSHAD